MPLRQLLIREGDDNGSCKDSAECNTFDDTNTKDEKQCGDGGSCAVSDSRNFIDRQYLFSISSRMTTATFLRANLRPPNSRPNRPRVRRTNGRVREARNLKGNNKVQTIVGGDKADPSPEVESCIIGRD